MNVLCMSALSRGCVKIPASHGISQSSLAQVGWLDFASFIFWKASEMVLVVQLGSFLPPKKWRFSPYFSVAFAEIGYGFVIRNQPPSQPHSVNIAPGATLLADAVCHADAIRTWSISANVG